MLPNRYLTLNSIGMGQLLARLMAAGHGKLFKSSTWGSQVGHRTVGDTDAPSQAAGDHLINLSFLCYGQAKYAYQIFVVLFEGGRDQLQFLYYSC